MIVKFSNIIILTFSLLILNGSNATFAQDYSQQLPPHVLESMSPEDQKYMKEMMKHLQGADGIDENSMFDAMMKTAESMPSQCRNVEEEIADAKDGHMEDIQYRNNFDYWFDQAQYQTPETIDKAEYRKEWKNCQSMASSAFSDIICHHQMLHFYAPQFLAIAENYDAIDEEKMRPIQEKYNQECAQKDLEVTRALNIDKPQKGDSLLVTKAGSFLLAERDGLIFGNNFPEVSKSGKSYFQRVQ